MLKSCLMCIKIDNGYNKNICRVNRIRVNQNRQEDLRDLV